LPLPVPAIKTGTAQWLRPGTGMLDTLTTREETNARQFSRVPVLSREMRVLVSMLVCTASTASVRMRQRSAVLSGFGSDPSDRDSAAAERIATRTEITDPWKLFRGANHGCARRTQQRRAAE
jgi:hypothetical protein